MKLCLSGDGQYFNLNNILTGFKIDFEQFQRMCVLAGCDYLMNIRGLGIITGLWQMFRTFVLRCDWSILRILKSTKKHERQSERVTLVSIYNNIFRLYHN